MSRIAAVALVALLSGCSSIPGLAGLFQPTLAGDWVVTRPNFSSFTMTLFDENGSITGASEAGGAIKGYRKGSEVVFTISHKSSSNTIYSGELSQDGKKVTGTIGNDDTDTFIANKKP